MRCNAHNQLKLYKADFPHIYGLNGSANKRQIGGNNDYNERKTETFSILQTAVKSPRSQGEWASVYDYLYPEHYD